jgi:DNA-directed RNA polymerase sigma subunit (sigma70/sigma32)
MCRKHRTQIYRKKFRPTTCNFVEARDNDIRDIIYRKEEREQIRYCLNHIKDGNNKRTRVLKRNIKILKMRFGFDEKIGPMSLYDVAKKLGLCRARVRQIEQDVMRIVREYWIYRLKNAR